MAPITKSDITLSHWHQTCREEVRASALDGTVTADLVVIGGGYTGLSAALHCAKAGLEVRLVEAGTFGGGGSGRNVGLVNAGLWLPPEEISARIGAAAGAKLSSALAGAPDLVFDLIEEFSIQCEPVRSGTLHCAHAPSGMRDLENRHRQLTAIGAPVALLSPNEAKARVGSEEVHGAIHDPRAGTIQPLGYAKGLARAAMERGAHLHENSPATAIERSGGKWIVTTPSGQITAQQMIIATNAYALPIKGLPTPATVPVHFFQAATEPLSGEQLDQILPGREGCWDTAMVMSSWRLDQAGRLILGGMGSLDHPGSFVHRSWVKRKLAKMFPALAGVTLSQCWHGRIAMTGEYLPKIMSPGEGALIAFGYSGRGIGPGTLFGKAMADALITGDTSSLPRTPQEHHTLPMAGMKQVYYETGATLTHLIKDRF
ncbi:FAD-binding oxidoreductase [Aliiroseovarius sp. KMU-50]|uniref:FAD-binding oxidoreductase n=1 Tax=Aliiroseovarius salicola TaxID=3009082 RepID=A0ABT4W6V0_9RHOB|nr:FAD-binding oxidoreductase [Aliiroseovarius sp. KMU-50]MDA5095628.1 FAD-binding oxidoreductase [Aliiroseovarius sp. KMU-50]